MAEYRPLPLKVVDGRNLSEPYCAALRPGEVLEDEKGRARRLPRFFYAIDSWTAATETYLAPKFKLSEFIATDVREQEVLRGFPRYIPCAVVLLATHLALFRERVGTYVHIAANGGYRSPGHAFSQGASPHHWGTAANIYRIGDDWLEDEATIEKYRAIAQEILPGMWTRPFGYGPGYADDHLHLDLGYVTVVPRDASGEVEE